MTGGLTHAVSLKALIACLFMQSAPVRSSDGPRDMAPTIRVIALTAFGAQVAGKLPTTPVRCLISVFCRSIGLVLQRIVVALGYRRVGGLGPQAVAGAVLRFGSAAQALNALPA
jgi:hypothetical protein